MIVHIIKFILIIIYACTRDIIILYTQAGNIICDAYNMEITYNTVTGQICFSI